MSRPWGNVHTHMVVFSKINYHLGYVYKYAKNN